MNGPSHIPGAMPLLVGLIGSPISGREDIAGHLKFRYGFARYQLRQPLYEALPGLYGIPHMDAFFERDKLTLPVGKTAQELAGALESHAMEHGGPEIFMRRLVERATLRGEWLARPIVVSDIANAAELQWLRQLGGYAIWVRRAAQHEPPLGNIQRLALANWKMGDCAIINEPPASMIDQVDHAIQWIHDRRLAAID